LTYALILVRKGNFVSQGGERLKTKWPIREYERKDSVREGAVRVKFGRPDLNSDIPARLTGYLVGGNL